MNVIANRAVLLSPHIDDVPLSLGASLLDGRFPSATVLNVFSISRSAYDDDDVERVTAARRLEDQRFFQKVQLPVERLYLDRLDAPLRLGITDDDVLSVLPPTSDSDEQACICSALNTFGDRHALLIAPLALGQHVDHVVVHRAACAAARDGWRVAFYEDAPYACDCALEEIQFVVDATSAELGQRLESRLFYFGHAGRTKGEAITVYTSQLGPTSIARICAHSMRFGEPAERLWFSKDF